MSRSNWLPVACLGCAVLLLAVEVDAAQADDPFLPRLKTEIKEDGVLKLDWDWQPYVAGPLFFLSVHRSGVIHVFRRDESTGDIRFMNSIPLAADLGKTAHLDPYLAFSSKNILYATGEWTHGSSDSSSIGLSWYHVETKDGSFNKMGAIPCSAGVLYASPDPNTLYLAAHFAEQVQVIRLDPRDGTPVVVDKLIGKGLGHGLVASPDKKFFYSLGGNEVSRMSCAPNGRLTYMDSLVLPDVRIKPDHFNLFISPDGRHVYVDLFKRYDPADSAYVALLRRDAKTGALTFGEKLSAMSMGGMGPVTFVSDGRTAYFVAEPEVPASGMGYFKRDPETGTLSSLKKTPDADAAFFFAYAPGSGTIYLGGNWSSKTLKVYSVPKDAGHAIDAATAH